MASSSAKSLGADTNECVCKDLCSEVCAKDETEMFVSTRAEKRKAQEEDPMRDVHAVLEEMEYDEQDEAGEGQGEAGEGLEKEELWCEGFRYDSWTHEYMNRLQVKCVSNVSINAETRTITALQSPLYFVWMDAHYSLRITDEEPEDQDEMANSEYTKSFCLPENKTFQIVEMIGSASLIIVTSMLASSPDIVVSGNSVLEIRRLPETECLEAVRSKKVIQTVPPLNVVTITANDSATAKMYFVTCDSIHVKTQCDAKVLVGHLGDVECRLARVECHGTRGAGLTLVGIAEAYVYAYDKAHVTFAGPNKYGGQKCVLETFENGRIDTYLNVNAEVVKKTHGDRSAIRARLLHGCH
jgi:hypothetical protein